MKDIVQRLQSASYYRCVLLVHTDAALRQRTVRELVIESAWPVVSVGKALAGALLSTALVQRPFVARDVLVDVLGQVDSGPLVCADIDLLFEPTLRLDPFSLLRDASRRSALVVVWPGSYIDDVLAYAVPEHAHYRTWSHPEVQIHVLS